VAASSARLSFPAQRSDCDALIEPAPLSERGFFLRAAVDDDLPWLRELYASTRAEEMTPVPWPEATKRAFLEQQFELQHRHFISHFAGADFWLVEGLQGPIGRLYRDRADSADARADDLIVDICFLPAWRGHGLGGVLLSAAQAAAAARGRGLKLHVQVHNTRALSLYQRLGFTITSTAGAHTEMRWPAAKIS
jgi:ribosomal protein S18 acetylase RimI-like enzyme